MRRVFPSVLEHYSAGLWVAEVDTGRDCKAAANFAAEQLEEPAHRMLPLMLPLGRCLGDSLVELAGPGTAE